MLEIDQKWFQILIVNVFQWKMNWFTSEIESLSSLMYLQSVSCVLQHQIRHYPTNTLQSRILVDFLVRIAQILCFLEIRSDTGEQL